MLPKVSIHRFCCAPFTNVENYRRIVGGDVIERDDLRLIKAVLDHAQIPTPYPTVAR